MGKLSDVTVEVKAKLEVDRRTAETCLRLVETFCNTTGMLITAHRGDNGEYEFEFEARCETIPKVSPEAFAAINAIGRGTHPDEL